MLKFLIDARMIFVSPAHLLLILNLLTPFNIILKYLTNTSHVNVFRWLLVCDINTNGTSFTPCNLNTPNEGKLEFFTDISNYLQDFQCDEIIIGGDFNLVMYLTKDKRGRYACTHIHSLEEIKEFAQLGMSKTYSYR